MRTLILLLAVGSALEWQKYCVDTVCNRCRSYLVRTMDGECLSIAVVNSSSENAKHYRRCLAITINPQCCQFETNLHFNVFPVNVAQERTNKRINRICACFRWDFHKLFESGTWFFKHLTDWLTNYSIGETTAEIHLEITLIRRRIRAVKKIQTPKLWNLISQKSRCAARNRSRWILRRLLLNRRSTTFSQISRARR